MQRIPFQTKGIFETLGLRRMRLRQLRPEFQTTMAYPHEATAKSSTLRQSLQVQLE